MPYETPYVPFSQRNGFESIPTQFELGVVPPKLRRLLQLAFYKEIERQSLPGYHNSYFDVVWKGIALDFHVSFLGHNPSSFDNNSTETSRVLNIGLGNSPIDKLFDLTEFFLQHASCSVQFRNDLKNAFQTSLSAYRIYDDIIVPIGIDQQGEAFVAAIVATEAASATGPRQHLINAAIATRSGEWANSVRESIHAVESAAKLIAPTAKTLGPALGLIEKNCRLHPAMKEGFIKLYGYTNDEQGIRHAVIDDAKANVDEADALFMLGACASFVSYLLARMRQAEEKQ